MSPLEQNTTAANHLQMQVHPVTHALSVLDNKERWKGIDAVLVSNLPHLIHVHLSGRRQVDEPKRESSAQRSMATHTHPHTHTHTHLYKDARKAFGKVLEVGLDLLAWLAPSSSKLGHHWPL